VAWGIVAGYFLLFAPLGDRVWNDAFLADLPRLQRLVFQAEVRYGVCALGVALLVAAAWDLASLVGGREPRSRA
jgi:hypothetical protein